MTRTTFAFAPPAPPSAPPVLDEHQQRVVDHPGGPLLVLAGPGTGKTTTLVEAIAARIEAGADPDSILALTFSRKAAEQLRDRVSARIGRTTSTQISSTLHSFAYSLIRSYAPADLYTDPVRLLSAPEQDVILQRLLTDNPESVLWPDKVAGALGTRGFATEVAAVLARAQEKGLGSADLQRLGEAERRPELVAAAAFMEQYDVVLGGQNLLDYPGLIAEAVALLQDPKQTARSDLRARYRHVFVDEYQDTDPAQVAMLREIAGDGANLTAVGDPHQSIYAFRGADVRGILDFPTAFPRADGAPAEVIVLQKTRRFGPRLLRASQRIANRLSLAGSLDEHSRTQFLNPVAVSASGSPGSSGNGRLDVLTFDTERAEAEHLADLLRRAHLEDGVDWSDMAVLVRSGRTTIPSLRRSLTAAGVPIEVASDDTPLVQEPAVLPLLDALRAIANLDNHDPNHRDHLDADRAHALLISPLGGLDATQVRALARALRAAHHTADGAGDIEVAGDNGVTGAAGVSSAALVRAAVLDPAIADALRDSPRAADWGESARDGIEKAASLARLLRHGHDLLEAGGTPEDVLWAVWSGTTWPSRLRGGVERGGPTAQRAHRDLDAIVALFEAAARAEEHRSHLDLGSFLDTLRAQQIPADTLADRGVRGGAVRLLTAHRSKGLEWPLVVIAHAQEGGWPDLRRRGSLLQADRISTHGLVDPPSAREMLAEERRLFYVASTRARDRLVVTAVASPEDDGDQPSRFLAELMPIAQGQEHPGTHVSGRPTRPLSLAGIVAELRRTVADHEQPEELRQAAARRLAALAHERVDGRPLVPAADPANWWGTRALTHNEVPVRPTDEPLTISASTLTSLLECPSQWFLQREAGGVTASTSSQGFGLIVHALAERIAAGELAADPDNPADLDALMDHVDAVWDRMTFRTPWSSARDREEVRGALHRFARLHHAPGARTVLATEQRLSAEVSLPDGQRVRLFGYADRLEIDTEGRVVVVDLKTGKYAPSKEEIKQHPQLGLYQLAVAHGAAETGASTVTEAGGAELWQLRMEAYGKPKVQIQDASAPSDDGEPRLIEEQLMTAAQALRDEQFPARAGKHCERCDFIAICPIKGAGTVLS